MAVIKRIFCIFLLNIFATVFGDKIVQLSKTDFDAAIHNKVALVQFFSRQ